jgi:competence protein ComEC
VSVGRAGVPRSAWLAGGVAAGAAAASLAVSPLVTLGLGCALVAMGLLVRAWRRVGPRGGPGGPGAPLLATGVGVVLVVLRIVAGPAPGVPPPLAADSRGPWIAVVESVGSPRDGEQVARLRLTLAAGTAVVAATLPAFPVIAAETVVEVEGRLRPPPDDDPYGEYLRRTGASGSLDATALRVVTPAPGASLQAFRDAAGDALRLALPEPEAGLASGILIGLRERVDRDLAADFATAGASHVVAISGWNIAIVAGIVGALLRGRSRRVIAVVVGATIAAYVVAAGASPSVVRAAVMASVVLLARESGRAGRAPAALAWAATLLLLASPAMIEDAGFRLSVLATAGLVAWATPLGDVIARLAGGRMPRWLAESLGISLAAQAATLPDVLATFGRLSLVSPAVNLLVVPLVPVAMAGGLLALGGGAAVAVGAPAWLATLAGLPGWLVLHVIVAVVRLGAGMPFAAVDVPPQLAAPAGLAAALALGGAIAWRRRGSRPRPRGASDQRRPGPAPSGGRAGPTRPRLGHGARVVLCAVVIATAIGSAAVAEAATRDTRLTVLDVGQGDAILLESRTGARMLVDGGPDPGRLLVELDARVPPWDRRLDIVVLTHPHEDHVAGLAALLDRYAVRTVYEPGMRGPGPGWQAWNARLADGPPRGLLATGARIRLGEFDLTVLWPDPGTVPFEPPDGGTGINNVSIVLLGEANGRRFLLTGDVEEDIDPHLLVRRLPRLDVLKVAHHGSATATTQAFLDAVRPRVAVASAGAGNSYGHPAGSTLGRLRDAGARVYRTDRDGSIEIELREDGVRVTAGGSRRSAATAPRPGPVAATVANGPRVQFLCGIAPAAGWPAAYAAGSPAADAVAIARGSRATASATSLGYDPSHDHPRAPRGRPAADVPRPARVVPPAFVRRGGRRGLAGATRVRPRANPGPGARGGGGAAARRGQAALGRGPGPPPARRRVRGLAGGPGLPGAGPGRARPPGHPAGGAGS